MEKLLEGQKVNVIVTSPPYAQQRKDGSMGGNTPLKNMWDWFW